MLRDKLIAAIERAWYDGIIEFAWGESEDVVDVLLPVILDNVVLVLSGKKCRWCSDSIEDHSLKELQGCVVAKLFTKEGALDTE